MNKYWVGRQVNGDSTIVVFDPDVQISDTLVFLYNKYIACIENFDRAQARAVFKTVTSLLDREVALEAYQQWCETYAGKQFLALIQQFKNGPEIPNYLHKLYNEGYQDGYAGIEEKDFDARIPEICRREYNHGYTDGANDLAVEQSLCVPSEFEEFDVSDYEDYSDPEDIAERRRETLDDERAYQAKLKYRRARQSKDEYEQYLKTDHWLMCRINALVAAQFQCQSCGRQEKLEVHHKTYVRRGGESPSDVTVLCYWCHRRRHSWRHRD